MVSYRVEGQIGCAGVMRLTLSWVNSASRRQQRTSVSFVALPGTHAFGHEPPVATDRSLGARQVNEHTACCGLRDTLA